MSDYNPCDGCARAATHYLCEECCNDPATINTLRAALAATLVREEGLGAVVKEFARRSTALKRERLRLRVVLGEVRAELAALVKGKS